jgi:hypothetical protein
MISYSGFNVGHIIFPPRLCQQKVFNPPNSGLPAVGFGVFNRLLIAGSLALPTAGSATPPTLLISQQIVRMY